MLNYRLSAMLSILLGVITLPLAVIDIGGVFIDELLEKPLGAVSSALAHAVVGIIYFYLMLTLAKYLKPFGLAWCARTLAAFAILEAATGLFTAVSPGYTYIALLFHSAIATLTLLFMLLLAILIIKKNTGPLTILYRYSVCSIITVVCVFTVIFIPFAIVSDMLSSFLLAGAFFHIAREHKSAC